MRQELQRKITRTEFNLLSGFHEYKKDNQYHIDYRTGRDNYIWPGDLAYYVMKYDLQLSKEFVEHMISQKWSVPDNIEIDFDNLEVI